MRKKTLRTNSKIKSAFAICALILIAPSSFSPVNAMPGVVEQKKEARYLCVMHPEVRSKKPGKCPKCGMQLREAGAEANPDSVANITVEQAAKKTDDVKLRLQIPNTTVYDQTGRRLNFYADLVKGKTVAINFIFTTCTTICPPLAATFRKVQQQMGERIG